MNWKIFWDACGWLAVFIVGMILLLFPAKFQQYVIRRQAASHWKFNAGLERLKSKSYISYLRLLGLFMILLALGMGYLIFFGKQ